MAFAKPFSLSALAAALLSIGCVATPGGMVAMPPPGADSGPPVANDGSPAANDGSSAANDGSPAANDGSLDAPADRSSPSDPGDGAAEATPDAQAKDAPRPWPPPGTTTYLPRLETQADYDQLGGGKSVTFIIRRRANDQAYPYPWDTHECVFEGGGDNHLAFLERMDPERALFLYFGDAKSVGGSLIPGRIAFDGTSGPGVGRILIENTTSLMSVNNDFPLDAAVGRQIRERMMRCVPFARGFVFSTVCPGGLRVDCPLP